MMIKGERWLKNNQWNQTWDHKFLENDQNKKSIDLLIDFDSRESENQKNYILPQQNLEFLDHDDGWMNLLILKKSDLGSKFPIFVHWKVKKEVIKWGKIGKKKTSEIGLQDKEEILWLWHFDKFRISFPLDVSTIKR